jgi:hypothetical protein
MSAVELLRGAGGAAAHAAPGPATDYHALGAFTETWAFLELFLGRCAETVGIDAEGEASARAEALARAVRANPAFAPLAGKTCTLAREAADLAQRRQALLEDLAYASLRRMGVEVCNAPPAGPPPALDALHMSACDLVRRTVLLLGQLKARRGGSA